MSLLEGRRAVVAGAGDIGSVVAQRLNDHGATVEVWDSSPEALAGVQGEGITVHQLDVTDRAAVARFGSITDLDPDDWQQTIDVNLTGVYLCCRAFVGPLAQAGGGSIINISSIGGLRGEPDFASYCASRFGVIGLTQSLAREVGSAGIRVNAVCPAAVESQMNTDTMARDARRSGITVEDVEQKILARTALGRLVQPSDIGDAVVFLASDLPSCITAESLAVTGGVF